jgi:hypothetical protein
VDVIWYVKFVESIPVVDVGTTFAAYDAAKPKTFFHYEPKMKLVPKE